jgi:hypothetical protein
MLVAMFLVMGSNTAKAQNCDPVSHQTLRSMAVQLGYTVTDIVAIPGKEKFSIMINSSGLDIPIALEISPSKKYIWLTVNLGKAPADTSLRNASLLKQNAIIQPCQFYVSGSGLTMMGLPLENSGITNAFLREKLEQVSKNVGNTEYIWKQQ